MMIGVMIVPTGIGAEIGGHAGDANPAAKLLASCCDTLITHPNVLNASDINEMTSNTLYVEGSMLDRFLSGTIGLQPVRQNKVLVLANAPLTDETLNAVNAARVTIGLDAQEVGLQTPLRLTGGLSGGVAFGTMTGQQQLLEQVERLDFDAVAIHSQVEVPRETTLQYYRNGGVNPWGRAEAMVSRWLSRSLDCPVAHAPIELTTPEDEEIYHIGSREVVDPRMSPEVVSVCYLHCVLKGLHSAPRITRERPALTRKNVDFMVSPWGCWGAPHRACATHRIPIIMVRENKTVLNEVPECPVIEVENYWEAAGVVMTMRAGVLRSSVRRPLEW